MPEPLTEDPPVFRVVVEMHIRTGKRSDFEKVWMDVGKEIGGHPANLNQWLMRSNDEDGVYYVISDWLNESKFREFERSPEHRQHRQQLQQFREDNGWMKTTHVLKHLRG